MKTVDEKVTELMNKNSHAAPEAIAIALRNAYKQGRRDQELSMYEAAYSVGREDRTSFHDRSINQQLLRAVAALVYSHTGRAQVSFSMKDVMNYNFEYHMDTQMGAKNIIFTASLNDTFEELVF